MPRAERSPPLGEAFALGLMQGPAELLPVSSSAHTTLIPWLAGWRYTALGAEQRKDFEIALHAGGGLVLAILMRAELRESLRAPQLPVMAGALAIPALTGLALEGPIERRLGGPAPIAAGLALGAVAMALADARGADGASARADTTAGWRDGLALGLAQAAALAPGVSRSGATLAMLRARGFARADAQALSWRVGLPVILAPVLLRAARLAGADARRPALVPCAAGAGAAALSTLASAPLRRRLRGAPLLPFAAYRVALSGTVAVRLARAKWTRR
jgi:undecaprenyl-diphosphatase